MKMSAIWQQILALDARYNAHRTPNDPAFRTLYIRRRSQLLRENAKKRSNDVMFQKEYLFRRSQLLAERYGYIPSEGSLRSRSVSIKSGSQLTLEGDLDSSKKLHLSGLNLNTTFSPSTSSTNRPAHEGYAFDGVHHTFSHHKNSITRLRFAHDEKKRVALASMDHTISVCNVSEQKDECHVILILSGHKEGIIDIVWSVSNDLLLSCSLDTTLRLWDPNTGECIRIVEDASSSAILCCLFQPLNNNLVVTGNIKGLIQVLNISTGKYLKTGTCRTPGAAVCMCCDNSGRLLWVGDDKGSILSFFMDSALGKLVKGRRLFIASGCPVTSLCCRPGGGGNAESKETLLLINVAVNTLCVYGITVTTGNIQLRRKIPIPHRRLTIHSSFCPLMSYRQGAFALTGSEDGCVHLCDVESNDRSRDVRLKGHNSPVIDVCFNHVESLLVSGDSKGTVIVWRRIKKENVVQ